MLAGCAAACLCGAVPGAAGAYTVYVANHESNTVTPIDTATGLAGSPIPVGVEPWGVAITPDAKTAYVANEKSNTLTPISVAKDTAGTPIPVGQQPNEVAITPNGKTAYVSDYASNAVTPVDVATNTPGSPIIVGNHPESIAITPDGTTAYVADFGSNDVTPINLATNTPGTAIKVGKGPTAIAMTPDGKIAYVVNAGENTVTPIAVATNSPGTVIKVGNKPQNIAITPDGATAYVAIGSTNNVSPISTATNEVGTSIAAGKEPFSLAIAPDGATAYVSNRKGATVSPITLASAIAEPPIGVGSAPLQLAITPDQAPVASFTATPATAGTASSFDASASTVQYGSITLYHWNFGDGESADTATPTTTHTYAVAGKYAVTLTETDSAGTSTSTVFTGQTMSRNGGASAQSNQPLTIVPPPPENTAVPTITGTPQQGQKLTEHNGSWTNAPTGYSYQWLRCNALGASCVPISGATGQTYVPAEADVEHTLAVQEIASNAGGSSTPATSAATAEVVPPPPANTAQPAITGLAQQEQTLTEHHGSWTNSPTGYEYQWERCNNKGEGCAVISAATGQEYEPVAADLGHTIRVRETASNAGGPSSPATSAATAAVVPPGAPVNTSLPTISGSAQQGQELTESNGTWTNGPTEDEYQWLRCDGKGEGCNAIPGATGTAYVAAQADVGHTLRAQETARNALGEGSPADSSASAVVLPLAPVNTELPTISGSAQEGQELTAHNGGWTNSPTGYEYQWLRCDSEGKGCTDIAGATGSTYDPVAEDVGQTVRVRETASNAGGSGSPAESGATAAVLVAPPEATSAPTITGTAQQGKTLTVHNASWTNSPTAYAYQWLRCNVKGGGCAAITGATEPTYLPVAEDVGHRLAARETATNAGGTGSPSESAATAVVVPPVPVDATPPNITGSAQQGQTLSVQHGSWSNSPTAYAYQWLRCNGEGEACVAIPGATEATYTPVGEDVGHALVVQETASNTGGSGSQAESPATTVVSAAPPSPTTASGALDPQMNPADPPAASPTHVGIATRSVTLTAGGDVLITLVCPRTAVGGCKGTITLALAPSHTRSKRAVAAKCARGCRSLGSTKYEARAGSKVKVHAHIASFGRRLIAQRKSVRATMTVTNTSGGQTATTTLTIVLKSHTHRHNKKGAAHHG
jgi:YVTN family beta-propeller protein